LGFKMRDSGLGFRIEGEWLRAEQRVNMPSTPAALDSFLASAVQGFRAWVLGSRPKRFWFRD